MRRGARFLILDQKDSRNSEADYIDLEIPIAQLSHLIEELEMLRSLSQRQARATLRDGSRETWNVHLLVEASHPKATGVKDPKGPKLPPSLLKDSIPRAGGS